MYFKLTKRPIVDTVLIFALQLIFLMFLGCDQIKDIVNVTNGSGEAIGLMVDGQAAETFVNDKSYISTNSAIEVDRLSLSSQTNEVVGFTNDRPPKYLNTPWTTNKDNFDLNFKQAISIPVTIWIIGKKVCPPDVNEKDCDLKQHAIESLIRTSDIWQKERMGVIFSSLNIIDATGDIDAPKHHAITIDPDDDESTHERLVWEPLRHDIGFQEAQLNIYWVNTVNVENFKGWSNFGAQIVMGRDTPYDLLVHEIGHAFSLRHIDKFVVFNGIFDVENIMNSSTEGDRRKYITEGQLFRSHLEPKSVLNVLYEERPDEFTRTCVHTKIATPTCPAIQKRLFSDGSRFPPN